jgi:hypothetical protein
VKPTEQGREREIGFSMGILGLSSSSKIAVGKGVSKGRMVKVHDLLAAG